MWASIRSYTLYALYAKRQMLTWLTLDHVGAHHDSILTMNSVFGNCDRSGFRDSMTSLMLYRMALADHTECLPFVTTRRKIRAFSLFESLASRVSFGI